MKFSLLFWLQLIVLLLVVSGCEDLPTSDNCLADTNIIIDPDASCTPSCTKTFRLRDVEKLADDVQFNWSLFRGTEQIPVPNPNDPDFQMDFDQSGEYNVIMNLTYRSQDCNRQLNREFTIGVDAVVAIIGVDTLSCTVGTCNLAFTNMSENEDTWFWSFPGESNDFQNQSPVQYAFNNCPDTVQVILTARNQGGVDRDTATIIVNPNTFDKTYRIASGASEKVMCVEEAVDGSFRLIGNTRTESYLAQISRDGKSLLNHTILPKGLLPNYSTRTVLDCHKTENFNVMIGRTLFNNVSNDVYLMVVDGSFSTGKEYAYFFPTNNAQEQGHDIIDRPGEGYLICGTKSTGSPIGMLLLPLDNSFALIKDSAKVLYPGNASHVATGIKTSTGGYMVVGRNTNPQTGKLEGCSFRIDQNYDTVPGSSRFYGNFQPEELIKINNSFYIMLGKDGNTAKVIAFDLTSIRWDVPYGNTELIKGMVTHSQQLAIVGSMEIGGIDQPFFLKLDIASGAEIHNEKYDKPNGRELLALDETKEKGFVFGGTNESPNDSMIIIRTNSIGLIN